MNTVLVIGAKSINGGSKYIEFSPSTLSYTKGHTNATAGYANVMVTIHGKFLNEIEEDLKRNGFIYKESLI